MNQRRISRRAMVAAGASLAPISLACGGSDPVVVKRGLLLDLHAEYLKDEQDGTRITTVRDESGLGNHLIASEGTAPVYQATGWDGLPSLDFVGPRWVRTVGRSLLAAISGDDPHFTLAMLIRPSANPNPGTLWSFSDPNQDHELSGTASETLGLETATATGGAQAPRGADYDQYTKAPFPQVCVWALAGRRVTIRVDGLELKLVGNKFKLANFRPTYFALGARLQKETIDVTGGFNLRRLVAYDRALAPEELSQIEYGLAAFGRLPKCGLDISELEGQPEGWDDSWRFAG